MKKKLILDSATQIVVPEPASSASPGDLLETQNLRLHPTHTKSESLWCEVHKYMLLTRSPRDFFITLTFEEHRFM